MIQDHVGKTGAIHQQITHDFILDVYEKISTVETEEEKRAIIETCRVLSESIGDYLVENEQGEED